MHRFSLILIGLGLAIEFFPVLATDREFCRDQIKSIISGESLQLLSQIGGQKVSFIRPETPESVYLVVRPSELARRQYTNQSLATQYHFFTDGKSSAVGSLLELNLIGVRTAGVRGFHLIERSGPRVRGGFRWARYWPEEILALELEYVPYPADYSIRLLNRNRRSKKDREFLAGLQVQAPSLALSWARDLHRMSLTGRVPDDLHSGNLGFGFKKSGEIELIVFDPVFRAWKESFSELRLENKDLTDEEFEAFHLGWEVFRRLQK